MLNLLINMRTCIVQINLPYFNRDNPTQGSKAARESLLKLITGMNNDLQPLNFRSPTKLNGEKDPYYAAAPGWTTLTGGNRPTHACTPASICKWLIEAAACVPFIKSVAIFTIEGTTQAPVTLEQVVGLNIIMRPVPFLGTNIVPNNPQVEIAQAAEAAANAKAAEAKAAAAETEAKAKAAVKK